MHTFIENGVLLILPVDDNLVLLVTSLESQVLRDLTLPITSIAENNLVSILVAEDSPEKWCLAGLVHQNDLGLARVLCGI